MEKHTHYGPRTSLHGALVGSGFTDRIRAHVHPSGGRFSHGSSGRYERFPYVSGSAANGLRDRRGARVGCKAELGKNPWGRFLVSASRHKGVKMLFRIGLTMALAVGVYAQPAGGIS